MARRSGLPTSWLTISDATGDPEKTGKPQLDARAGKANFVRLWGQEQSLREVKRLVAEAQKALDPIDADRQALRISRLYYGASAVILAGLACYS